MSNRPKDHREEEFLRKFRAEEKARDIARQRAYHREREKKNARSSWNA
jgi:hypothetical protein